MLAIMFGDGICDGVDHNYPKARLIVVHIPSNQRNVSTVIASAPFVLPIVLRQVK